MYHCLLKYHVNEIVLPLSPWLIHSIYHCSGLLEQVIFPKTLNYYIPVFLFYLWVTSFHSAPTYQRFSFPSRTPSLIILIFELFLSFHASLNHLFQLQIIFHFVLTIFQEILFYPSKSWFLIASIFDLIH